ncbi:MAG TPA: SpoIIE family protein phosphatase [Paludibaculum sp.]
MPPLKINLSDGSSRLVALRDALVSFGRAAENDYPFLTDTALSRRHLTIAPENGQWFVEDLKSKNGTRLNGAPLQGRQLLSPGDRIEAGSLVLIFHPNPETSGKARVVFPDMPSTVADSPRIARTLNDVVSQGEALPVAISRDPIRSAALISALLEAGRELAGRRTLPELFQLVLDLTLKSVAARRGVVLTLENGELVPGAALGDEFQISSAVRDRVLHKRESLLIADLHLDQSLKDSRTLMGQKVRSLMAVPLQTRDKVIGLIYVDSPDEVNVFNTDDLGLLTVLANIAAARIENARLLEVEEKEQLLRQELEQAAEIQRSLFPKQTPAIRGIELCGASIPCRAVGGDFYDYLPLPDGRLGILIGDVAGKGLPAALLMSGLLARAQVLAGFSSSPVEIISRLNKIFAASCPGNRFVTLFLLALDPASGSFSYCNAGHNPPYLIHRSGASEMLTAGGPVVGIFGGLTYAEGAGTLNPGDLLLLFSDGVSEAQSPEGCEFGEHTLLELVRRHRAESCISVITAIRSAVEEFQNGAHAHDDSTLVAVRRP